jgi:hypothetical protein
LVRCEDGLQSLEPALDKLHYLMVQMDVLADYWRDMHSALEDLHERVDELRNDSLFQLNIRDLEQDWKRVRGDYMDYKTEVCSDDPLDVVSLPRLSANEAARSHSKIATHTLEPYMNIGYC